MPGPTHVSPPHRIVSHRYPYDPRYSYEPRGHAGARAACVIFGLLSGLLIGGIVWLTVGQTEAILAAGAIALVALYGAISAPRGLSIFLSLLLVVVFAGGAWYVAHEALAIYRAVNNTAGAVDPADPAALAAATRTIEDAAGSAGFRVEMGEDEIGAYLQDGLAQIANNPIRKITVDVRDGIGDDAGTVSIQGSFKSGELGFEGTLSAGVQAGAIEVEVVELELGPLDLPGIGRGAVEDLLAGVADLNEVLGGLDADVQSITIGDDRIVVTGTHPAGELITSTDLLQSLADRAAAVGTAVEPPPERTPPGTVNGVSAPGTPVYVALGDSLAANVGVDDARRGYVSRVHAALSQRDGQEYGLRNFGISGETSGTMIRTGQLDTALAYMNTADVAYVTIDIGANDLLGHLGSEDCSTDIDAPPCQRRLDAAFTSYEDNLTQILDALLAAAPDATIVFLESYNPFSLGLAGAVTFEERSDEILQSFNDLAARIARQRGVVVADGFTPMLGTTAATTHMLDNPPDIHPRPIGYDVLATAILDALG